MNGFFVSIRVTCLLISLLISWGEAVAGDAALGERLYNEGILASGQPLQGTTQNDLSFSGVQFSCASCHRKSGFGSSEGGNFVPPITGSVLFQDRSPDRAFMFKKLFKESQPRRFWSRVRQPRMRPAYTAETLARAIRDGVDPTGRALGELMPRYTIPDADMDNLSMYLKSLSVTSDPGVDDQHIYFATIVTEHSDPAKREAMLATMREFIAWMNADTLGDLSHPNFSPNYRTDLIDAYRVWKFNVWEMTGPPETWQAQLAAAYEKQPVFAIVSGLIKGPWQPIDQFCESRKVPCLFPNTELPVVEQKSEYSVHFHRGLMLEAEAVGQFVANMRKTKKTRKETPQQAPFHVLQLYHPGPRGRVPAHALERSLQRVGGIRLSQHSFSDLPELQSGLRALPDTPDAVIIWPGEPQTVLEWLLRNPPPAPRLFLPAAALEYVPTDFPQALQEKLYFSFPYEIPSAYHPRAFRVRAWMRSRHLDIPYQRLQFNTYYALTMIQFGLEHIVNNFSRDYLLEYVEHEAENALNPGTFPRLSLGPGQRFASKGAYIVQRRNDADVRQQIVAVSEWIVP